MIPERALRPGGLAVEGDRGGWSGRLGLALAAWAGGLPLWARPSPVCYSWLQAWLARPHSPHTWSGREQMVLHFGVFCSEWALWGWNGQGCAGSGCLSDRYVFCFRVAGANPHPELQAGGTRLVALRNPWF